MAWRNQDFNPLQLLILQIVSQPNYLFYNMIVWQFLLDTFCIGFYALSNIH